ncbi:HWE histidine kinase domain-containing protein [Roseococcus sp.]|uniref:HWE histidine kinase domain-containing protein n=1 Tax=Roseococcus sp. TaxID=2109646 RepID=UPI003BAB7028
MPAPFPLRSRRTRFALLLPFAAVLVPIVTLAGGAWLSWRTAIEDATLQLSRTADAGAEYAARVLEAQAVAVGRINERLRGLSDRTISEDERRWHDELGAMVEELPQADLAFVLDRNGHPLVASNLYPVPRDIDVTDRDYFIALRAEDAPSTYVSRPFLGRVASQLLFAVGRRRVGTGNDNLEPGAFDGLIFLAIRPSSLAEGMRRLLGPEGDMLALVRDDGYILSRTIGQDGLLPPIPRDRAFHAAVASGESARTYRTISSVEGFSSLNAVRRIEGFPIYAVSLRPTSKIVAHWGQQMVSHLLLGIPAALLLLLLALRVRRDQLRLDAINSGLEDDVERSADRLQRAARFGLVATFEIDLRTGVNRRSGEYMELQGEARSPAEEKHENWVRRLHPDDRARAEGHFLHAISDTSAVTEYSQSYRIVTATGETRWIAARGEIERDEHGRALLMRGAHVDVTPLRSAEQALAESDARLRLAQEAAGVGTWEWNSEARTLNWSRMMIELWGFDPEAGQPDVSATVARIDPADRGKVRREMARAQRHGTFRCEFRIRRPRADEGPEGEGETIWITAQARRVPLDGRPGSRLLGVAYNVTERKLAEEQTALLAHEVEHRAKNALAIVSGLLRVTTADTPETFVQIMEGRVQALARTMTLLSQYRWKGAQLKELVQHELAPFGEARVALSGPPVMLGSEVAQPLSMAVHELTTNAAKYGALSAPGGRLEVTWWIEGTTVQMVWREIGGPRLDGPPAHQSFGTQLIRQTFENRLGGRMQLRWEPDGLVCELSFEMSGAA